VTERDRDRDRVGDRERIRTAHGSLHEPRAQLKLGVAWGYVARAEVEALDAGLDRVAAMTWRGLHPTG
jgi:hypothetical protein